MPKLKLPTPPATFLLYGDTGVGKTLQAAMFAKWVCKQTGGKVVDGKIVGGLRARYYCSDNGGWRTIQPFIDAGIVEVVDCRQLPHPFLWSTRIATGLFPKVTGVTAEGIPMGSWVAERTEEIGVYIFDSLTGTSELMMDDLATKAAEGIDVGGGGAYKFSSEGKDSRTSWGTETIGANNQSHYGAVQQRIIRQIGQMNNLAQKTDSFVIATATARRDQNDAMQKVMGPQVAGKALTAELPRLFTYTMHMVNEANTVGEPEHKLYFCSHKDITAGNAIGLANRRIPMINPKSEAMKRLPAFVSPADLVGAYELILKAEKDVLSELLMDMK